MKRFTMDSIAKIGFGAEFGSLDEPHEEFSKSFDGLQVIFFFFIFFFIFFFFFGCLLLFVVCCLLLSFLFIFKK